MGYWILRFLFIVLLKIFFRFRVEGRENLPRKTNFIVAANHASFLDALVVGTAIGQRTYWIASRKLYRVLWLRVFFMLIDAIPSGNASRTVVALLERNKNVGLFPEGHVTRDGRMHEFKSGAALMAIKTGRPIVPCAIIGTYEALPINGRFPKLFSPITIKIGKPKYLFKEFDEVIDDVRLQEGMMRIKKTIKELMHAC
ncbi:MAG: lysophospholipid acyltransferase family protein [bacterium]